VAGKYLRLIRELEAARSPCEAKVATWQILSKEVYDERKLAEACVAGRWGRGEGRSAKGEMPSRRMVGWRGAAGEWKSQPRFSPSARKPLSSVFLGRVFFSSATPRGLLGKYAGSRSYFR